MREAAIRGFWVSTCAPFGYKKVSVQDGAKKRPKLELDSPADAVVRRIFQMALQGKSTLDITKTLNGEGIPTSTGKHWLKSTVHRILSNEAYTGTLVWGVSAKDKAPPVRMENAFPAIVPKEQLSHVVALLDSRAPSSSHPRRSSSSYLLSGLVKCERCGKALSGQESKSGQFAYYVCGTLMKRGSGTCNAPRLNSKRFEGLIVDQIRENILTEGNIRDLVSLVNEEMDGVAGEQRQNLETIEEELEEVRRWLDRLYRAIETTDLDISDITPRIKEHRERRERLEIAAAKARVLLSERRVILNEVDTITAFARDMSDYLVKSSLTESRAFIKSFIREIAVAPGKATIRYTIPISQSTPKTQLLLGGRSEEFWVSNEAEASSQLVWDVERRLSPAGNWHHTIIMDGSRR